MLDVKKNYVQPWPRNACNPLRPKLKTMLVDTSQESYYTFKLKAKPAEIEGAYTQTLNLNRDCVREPESAQRVQAISDPIGIHLNESRASGLGHVVGMRGLQYMNSSLQAAKACFVAVASMLLCAMGRSCCRPHLPN